MNEEQVAVGTAAQGPAKKAPVKKTPAVKPMIINVEESPEVEETAQQEQQTVHFYSVNNHHIVFIDVPQKNEQGQYLRDLKGNIIGDTTMIRFSNRHYATSDPQEISMLTNKALCPAYGGDGLSGLADPSGLYWINGYPREVKLDLERRQKYITKDPNEYESDENQQISPR